MKFKGFSLIRVFGIQIIIDYTWFIIFFLVTYSLAEIYYPQTQGGQATLMYWVMGTVAATFFFISVLLHELAHSLVAMRQGIQVTSIRLFIFGGIAQIASEPKSGRHEFLIAIAGPAMSMMIAFFFGLLYLTLVLSGAAGPVSAVAGSLAGANMILAVFNMIPGFPLDGGRILRAILWDHWNDLTRATRVVSQIGNAFSLFLIILGVMQFLLTQSIISGLWFVLIGLFMRQVAAGSYQAVVIKESLAGVKIRQIMTEDIVTVDWLISVDELVRDYFYKHYYPNFPVFDRDQIVGMVSLSQVKSVPKELWRFKQVRDIMTPIEQVPRLGPTDDATEVLNRMVTEDSGRMPVMEDGRLVGIVSRQDILNLFKIKSDLGTPGGV
jgi:Zn-dependent protease/predicted transcriptional regulator